METSMSVRAAEGEENKHVGEPHHFTSISIVTSDTISFNATLIA